MPEPTTSGAAGILGVKYAVAVAGFAGGVVSLAFIREQNKLQMALAVLTGSVTAAYLTPIAIPLLARAIDVEPSVAFENAAAFILGLTAMNLIAGIIHLSEVFRHNPNALLKGKDNP